jgi:predicted phage terminase large subunit-like protein
MQTVLINPEETICILSNTRPLAKSFLRVIKREFEDNRMLKQLFSDIIWDNPKKDAPKWSEDEGLIVKRKTNPKESTFEAHGIDAQPIGKHFGGLIYEDMVTRESVTTPEMIAKTTEGWELSRALGRTTQGYWTDYAATRYHFNDTYGELIRRGVVNTCIHAATHDGTVDGKPVLLTPEQLAVKRREMGPYVFSCQMLMNPVADERQNFRDEWLMFYEGKITGQGMNCYLLVDPASDKKRKTNDYTSILVIGLGADKNYYLVDAVRDRLTMAERTRHVFRFHRMYQPKKVGYEEYGMQSDIAYLKASMSEANYRFEITPLKGMSNKNDRIRTLIPLYEQHRFWLPQSIFYTNYEGKTVDLISSFINEEYKPFPVPVYDDFIDTMARITDPDLETQWPKHTFDINGRQKKDRYALRNFSGKTTGGWMGR